jgi:hypothetical protein
MMPIVADRAASALALRTRTCLRRDAPRRSTALERVDELGQKTDISYAK